MTSSRLLRRTIHVLAVAALAAPSSALAGGLAPAFGTGGGMVHDLPGHQDASAVASLSDGRIQVAGIEVEQGVSKVLLRRYLANGAPDTSFGAGGVSRAAIAGGASAVSDVAIQPDGKIVVALSAKATATSADTDAFVVRFSGNGIYDSTFGTRGVATITAPTSLASTAEVALTPTGQVLLSYDEAGSPKLARFTYGGKLDPSFNGTGIAAQSPNYIVKPSAYVQKSAGGIRVLPDGSVIQAFTMSFEFNLGLMLKYNAAGTSVALFGHEPLASGVDVEIIGQDIVLAGHAVCPTYTSDRYAPHSTSAAIARYKPDGSMRVTSGSSGVTLVDCASHNYGSATGLAITKQNVVILAGARHTSSYRTEPMNWRLTGTGTLAAGFGIDGVTSVEFGARTGSHSNFHDARDITPHGTGAVTAIDANANWLMGPDSDSDIGLARVNQ